MKTHTIFAAALLAAALPLAAQDWKGKGRVEGTVTDIEGKPVAGATVTLLLAGNPGPAAVTTDEAGKFEVPKIAFGAWKLRVEAEGFRVAEGDVPLSKEQSKQNVTIKLQARNFGHEAINRAAEAYNAGKWAEARVGYEKALELLPPEETDHVAMVTRMLAQVDLQEGKPQQAIPRLQALLAARPEDVELRKFLVQAQLKANDKAGAIANLKELLAANPSDAMSLDFLVGLLVETKEVEEAEGYLAQAPAGVKVEPVTLLNLGIHHYNAKAYDKARAVFDRVIAEYPERADTYYLRGQANLALKQNAAAKADLEQLLALDPGHARAPEVKALLKKLG